MPADVFLQRLNNGKVMYYPTTSGQDSFAFRDLMPAAALLMAGLVGLLVASLSGPERNGQYLVIAAPWSSLGQTVNLIGSADGGIVEAGRFRNMVVAASSRADFANRARDAGAWLVFPSPRSAGCFDVKTEISEK